MSTITITHIDIQLLAKILRLGMLELEIAHWQGRCSGEELGQAAALADRVVKAFAPNPSPPAAPTGGAPLISLD
jgi:hypothetical protein